MKSNKQFFLPALFSRSLLFLPAPLRVGHGGPGQSDVPLAGVAGRRWTRKGAGSRFVNISLNKSRLCCVRLRAGLRLHAGRETPGLSAKIWCCLLVLPFVAVLPWPEPKVTEWRASRTSRNKAVCGVPHLVGVLPIGRRGGGTRRLLTGSGAPGKIDEAASWSSYAVARCSHGDLRSAWRPLHTLVQFLRMSVFNLLRWRPFNLDAAVQAHLRPSGFVPGVGMSRRGRRFISAGGDEEGLDGFFADLSRVFFVRTRDLAIIFFILKVIYVTCTSIADI
jgi:hypothetical protein